MTKTTAFPSVELPEPPGGFILRDILRFLTVDIVVVILLKLLLGLGFFATPDQYVLTILGSKVVLALYLVWLVRRRDDAWAETGLLSLGRWWAWPAAIAAYAALYPLLVRFNQLNGELLAWIYHMIGWTYQPAPQDVMVLLFNDIINLPTRLVLLSFAVIWGPLMEEVAFRGVGLDAFRRVGGVASGILWTSLLFGLYHFSAQTFLPLSLMGALFAVVRVVSGSLWCSFALHALHNAVALYLTAKGAGVI